MAQRELPIVFHQLHWLDEVGGKSLSGVAAYSREIRERLRKLPRHDAASLRAVRREYSKRLAQAAPHVVEELAQTLLEEPGAGCRLVAYELLHHHPGALDRLRAFDLKQLGRGMSSWSDVDMFAIYVAGPVWRARHVPDSLIRNWARSSDRWWRRAALVSTVPLNSKAQGGKGDTRRTLELCLLLQRDRDPMVVKALSWALRELAKRNPKAVRGFLIDRKHVLAALVLREVRNKLRTGRKNPPRRKS